MVGFKQASIQQIQNRFRSGGMVINNCLLEFIDKSKGFSQLLLAVPADGNTISENQISLNLRLIGIIKEKR
jgi:hypothetical protein